MAITKTVVEIPGFGTREMVGFDLTEAQVRATLREEASLNINNYTCTTRVEGDVKYISFQRRAGDKGLVA